MKKTTIVAAAVIVAAGLGLWFFFGHVSPMPQTAAADYKSSVYTVEGQQVPLVNGKAEIPSAPGSASMVTTSYFGNEATGDLNGDGTPDTAFILTQNPGGSGTFYYVVAAIKTANGYQGTNAVLLGDRIAPQTTEINNGQITVNYADRNPGEPMTTQPSAGKSMRLKVSGQTLSEIAGAALGEHCGGNMANAPVCAAGLHCAATPGSHLPVGDVGGTCAAN